MQPIAVMGQGVDLFKLRWGRGDRFTEVQRGSVMTYSPAEKCLSLIIHGGGRDSIPIARIPAWPGFD